MNKCSRSIVAAILTTMATLSVSQAVSPREVLLIYYGYISRGMYFEASLVHCRGVRLTLATDLKDYLEVVYGGMDSLSSLDRTRNPELDRGYALAYDVVATWANEGDVYEERTTFWLAKEAGHGWCILRMSLPPELSSRAEIKMDPESRAMYEKVIHAVRGLEEVGDLLESYRQRYGQYPDNLGAIRSMAQAYQFPVNPFNLDGAFHYALDGDIWYSWSEGPNGVNQNRKLIYDMRRGLVTDGDIVISNDGEIYTYIPGVSRHPDWDRMLENLNVDVVGHGGEIRAGGMGGMGGSGR